MSDSKQSCDLCGLPVEVPDFKLETSEGSKHFCCEGCQGIFQIFHEAELLQQPDSSQK